MKILHVITSLRAGGAEKLMVDLLPRLRDRGNEVEILVFDGTRTAFMDQLENSLIPIHILGVGRNVYDLRNVVAVMPYLKQYDIVHTHNTACQYFVALAKKISGAKCALITTEHSTSNRRRGRKLFKILDNWMYHSYQSLICVSKISGDNIKEYTGDYDLPIFAIPNGIDFECFNSAKPNDAILKDYSYVHRSVMVAGFRYEKDHPTVIKAFALLPESHHLFCVGDGERRQEYEQLAVEKKCSARVHFLGVRSDIPSILRAANLVIMSSHREGLSLSCLEGMASGNPFIASDVEGLHEIVNGYGILFEHENEEQLAQKILEISQNSTFAEQIGQRCVEKARQYDISHTADRYVELYKKKC